jgi:outer membrane protein assembly factor BamB
MRKLTFAVALLILATTASAQMHRQQPGSGSTTGPMHFAVAADGSVIVLASLTEVVALSTATGNVAWTVKLTGTPMQIETAGNQIFVMVVDTTDSTTMPVRRGSARTLLALSSAGTVLWSKKIDN